MASPLALEAYQSIIKTLEEKQWSFERNDEKLIITAGFLTDDLDITLSFLVDDKRGLIRLSSHLPFQFSEDKRLEGAVATTAINFLLVSGCFDYDLSNGSTMFRMTYKYHSEPITGYRTSVIRPSIMSAVEYLIGVSLNTIDEYDDQLYALAKGYVDLSTFLDKVDEEQ